MNNKESRNGLKGFYTILKYQAKKIQYLNKSFNKVYATFIEIEA